MCTGVSVWIVFFTVDVYDVIINNTDDFFRALKKIRQQDDDNGTTWCSNAVYTLLSLK